MSGNRDVIYWDSCVFYALIKAEEHREGELESVRRDQRAFDAGEIVLVTSYTQAREAPWSVCLVYSSNTRG